MLKIEEQWIHVENAQVYPQNVFLYIFTKDKKKSSINFMVKSLVATWKKIK